MSASPREDKLQALGFELSKAGAAPGGLYLPAQRIGNLVYTAGCIPMNENKELVFSGKVGADVSLEVAQEAAKLCTANMLRAVHGITGDLESIKSIVKITGFVNSANGFTDQHLVLNAASQMLGDIFGDTGTHARSAVGVAELPLNAAVEIEGIFEIS